jgi:hypothetical protein
MKFLIICPTNPFPPPTLPSASLSPTAKSGPPSQPQIHRRNWAERDIQTFKNHFISGLCSTHPDFPLNLWDKLLPQATLTLNLLRPSPINPKLSAYAQIHGAFNFDKTPLAPPGIKVHTLLEVTTSALASITTAATMYGSLPPTPSASPILLTGSLATLPCPPQAPLTSSLPAPKISLHLKRIIHAFRHSCTQLCM